jgi:hypothetical protein
MTSKQCTSLQARAVDFFVTSSSDTPQLSLLSGMDTPAKSSENEQQMDGSLACQCGKETSDCSIHPSTPEKWTAFMRDSLALILALPENRQASALKQEAASTVKPSASLALFDQNTCSWKTLQTSLLTDSEPYLQTLPRSGMTRNGYVYELPIVGRLTKEIDGGYLPTPTAHDAKKGAYPSEYNRNTPGIAVILGGKPAPTFQEWQMGWPINHTALKALGTGKSRSKPQQHGSFSEAPK